MGVLCWLWAVQYLSKGSMHPMVVGGFQVIVFIHTTQHLLSVPFLTYIARIESQNLCNWGLFPKDWMEEDNTNSNKSVTTQVCIVLWIHLWRAYEVSLELLKKSRSVTTLLLISYLLFTTLIFKIKKKPFMLKNDIITLYILIMTHNNNYSWLYTPIILVSSIKST